jgi:TPP-dependent pyruvate/acetoin dehydrogenase alpha subunit
MVTRSQKHKYTSQEIIDFEKDIANCFNEGKIKAPVHLSSGNEQQLIDIFRNIGDNDWVCGTWRFHIHCLLKGVPPDKLKQDILAGKSITLCYPEYKLISSAIAGGIIPIAVGMAWSIKRRGGNNKVWCFVGDMVSYMGIFSENLWYAAYHELPIEWTMEDNGKSVNTPTDRIWLHRTFSGYFPLNIYEYQNSYPHSGAGEFVRF